jgi:hypothetical protein
MRLVINGYDIELTPTQSIARTLQVNDILTLSNRQSNYTNTFSVKRTDKNKQIFELLGVVGITNFLPYQKNECYLYTDDGECMVYKGWAVIQSTDKDYKINLYDGNIDLYKAIENKSLGDLDLSELNHIKNLSNVVNTFTANLPYKYIVADYNGEKVYNSNRINIDYIVPSAKVSYLWYKIFDTYGFTYEGSVFNTVDFTNLWLTYPKFTNNNIPPTAIFQGTTQTLTGATATVPLKFNQSIVIDNIQDTNKQQFIISADGGYRVELNNNGGGITYEVLVYNRFGNFTAYQTFTYANIYKNGILIGSSQDDYIDYEFTIGDVITVQFQPVSLGIYDTLISTTYSGDFTLIISEFVGQAVSFTNELKDFSIKDFITEILNRFGITPFKDKYENHYKFLTLQELLQYNEVIDWSREQNKFVEKISEKYIFGSYAQQNDFTYKYNDIESDYYNSKILIDNKNLADKKTVVNSKIFAPEKDQTFLIHDLKTNVYKMWDKEVQDNGTVQYKGLQKRYYLMRERSHTFTTTTQIGSKVLGTHQAITTVPAESFYNLGMEDIVRNYYNTIGAILNYSKIIEATIYLTEKNISDIDFSKLYWIKELSSYFLLNKVNSFTKKGVTKVELIKVDYVPKFSGEFLVNNGINLLIDEVKKLVPRIHFGFGQREITASVGQTITIYQDTIYNPDVYDLPIQPTGSTLISSELNKIQISYPSTGVYTANVRVQTIDKTTGIENTSNDLKITIV